jgi:hypothetical protein
MGTTQRTALYRLLLNIEKNLRNNYNNIIKVLLNVVLLQFILYNYCKKTILYLYNKCMELIGDDYNTEDWL